MGNRSTPAGGSDSDSFRRQAYQDSEVLSEDIVRSIIGSGAFKDLRGLLGVTVEQALRKAVTDSLKDPEIQRAIREQVATTVIAGLKKEIHDRQSEILANARGLLPAWEGQVTQAVAYEQERKRGQRSTIDQGSPDDEPPARRDDGPETIKPRKPLPSWLKSAAAAVGIVLALVVGLFAGKGFSSRPDSRQESRQSAAGASDRGEPDRKVEVEEESSLERLFVDRMRIPEGRVEHGSDLAAELQARSYADQYRCWFDEETRRRLDDLFDNPGLERATFEATLRDAFAPCVATDYPLGTSKLPVFAAQGLVRYLLERERDDGWDLCVDGKKPDGLPDLERARSDGEPGQTTNALLNSFLACTDRSDQLQIGPNSTSEEYLFTLYATLKELERR